jgi:hypothetical protein
MVRQLLTFQLKIQLFMGNDLWVDGKSAKSKIHNILAIWVYT